MQAIQQKQKRGTFKLNNRSAGSNIHESMNKLILKIKNLRIIELPGWCIAEFCLAKVINVYHYL